MSKPLFSGSSSLVDADGNMLDPVNARQLMWKAYWAEVQRKEEAREAKWAAMKAAHEARLHAAQPSDFKRVFLTQAMPDVWKQRMRERTGERVLEGWMLQPRVTRPVLHGLRAFRLTSSQATSAGLTKVMGEVFLPDPEGLLWEKLIGISCISKEAFEKDTFANSVSDFFSANCHEKWRTHLSRQR